MARRVPYRTGMRDHPSRRRSGFTFIEMLIVFVVFGAVAMISIRSVGDTLRRDRVAKVSAILSADIEQAFATAARLREPVRMVVDRSNRRFYIQDRQVTPTIYKTRLLDATGNYDVDSLTTNRDTVDIMPNGLATDTLRITLIVKSKGGELYTKSVRASKGGLIRVDNR
jgi:prepilin-type N-terminal cleavage/methylation domain-containing protein